PYELVERMRASIIVLGPLLASCGVARVALPGGDDFGPRPIDMHLRGLEALGASFEAAHGYIEGRAEQLTGTRILLQFPSVGATADHMDMRVQKLGEMGMRISPASGGLWAYSRGRLRAVDVATLPYPGIATDYKPLFVALLSVADGVGIVTENLFAGRFRY